MDKNEALENCPHCSAKLSPWQKVLLNVDRVIVCKNCWYKILLEPDNKDNSKINNSKELGEKRGNDGNI